MFPISKMEEFNMLTGTPVAKIGNRIIKVSKSGTSPYLKVKKAEKEKSMTEYLGKQIKKHPDLLEAFKAERDVIEEYPALHFTKNRITTGKDRFDPEVSFELAPDVTKKREIVYIFAPSGSGKSVLCAQYMQAYHDRFPDRPVYLISQIAEDESIPMDFVTRPEMDEEFLNCQIDYFGDSLVVFDDADNDGDNAIGKKIQELKNKICKTGRHEAISCLITTHMAANYKETRLILNEISKLVIFPHAGPNMQNRNLLVKYGGFTGTEADMLLRKKSRWVMVSFTAPKYFLTQTELSLFD